MNRLPPFPKPCVTGSIPVSLDFMHRLQDGFSAEQAAERTSTVRAEFERPPLLAFDDFSKGHFTPWVMQEYASFFDYRAMAGLPTFLTTNLSPKQMREQFGDYLIGRMLAHCQVLHVEGADTKRERLSQTQSIFRLVYES